MGALRRFLLQLGNRRFVGCKLAAQRQYGGVGYDTRSRLDLGEPHLFLLQVDQLLRGVNLSMICGPCDDGIGDIAGEGEERRLVVGVCHIYLSVKLFNQTALPAKDIERIGDTRRQSEYIEHRPWQFAADIGGAIAFPRRAVIASHCRKENTIAAAKIVLTGSEACLRRFETWVIRNCLGDDRVKTRRLEQSPPVGGYHVAQIEMLSSAINRESLGGLRTVG